MAEANIGLWFVMFLFLLGPIAFIHMSRLFNYSGANHFTKFPVSFAAELFAILACISYFICVLYTDRVKKQKTQDENIVKTRDMIYNVSIGFVISSLITLLLSFKFS